MLAAWSLLVLGAAPPALFWDTFTDNAAGWLLDDGWTLADGQVVADGVDGQILVLDGPKPTVADFRAGLIARPLGEPREDQVHGWGLVYRFDAATGEGYFVDFGVGGLYGFGLIAGGRFELQTSGQSSLLAGGGAVEIEIRGGIHALRSAGTLIDVWRDERHTSGGFGLLVVGAVRVAFEELRLDDLGGQPRSTPPARIDLGPGPPPATPRGPLLRPEDVDRATRWRRHWNRVAEALGEPALPADLDLCDLAVLTLLRDRAESGQAAPAQLLADFLVDEANVRRGAGGAAAEAALRFWLDFAAAEAEAGDDGLLAALSWWYAVRARQAAAWGEQGAHALRLSNELLLRLDGDRRRYVETVAEAGERERRQGEIARALNDAPAFLPRSDGR